MVDQIREKLNSIDGIILKRMQINFGNENIIEIEIKDVQDFPKWDYFCERVSRNTSDGSCETGSKSLKTIQFLFSKVYH